VRNRQEQVTRPNRRRQGFAMPKQLTQRAWAAGFFDGEGYISVRNRTTNTTKQKCIDVELVVSNTSEASIIRLQSLFGGYIQHFSPKKINLKPFWRWTGTPNIARIFLKATLPYLVVKKEQAEMALEILNLKNFQRTAERYEREAALLLKINNLTKRGNSH